MKHTDIPVKKNDELSITIDAVGSEGQGVGRVNGYAIFVPGALAGETVRTHIIKVTASYAVGKLLESRFHLRIACSRLVPRIRPAAAAPCSTWTTRRSFV